LSRKSSWKIWGKTLGKFLIMLLPVLLLWWAFQSTSIEGVLGVLRQLTASQMIIWLLVNLVIVTGIVGRWWLILIVLGYRIPYLALTRYRFASFAVSYFTPGPQFGGEPIQVLALQQRHDMPGSIGSASVGLDKLLELIANFSFLVFGITILLAGTWLPVEWRNQGMAFALGLLAFPLAYLVLMLIGVQPLNWLKDHLPQKIAQNWISLMLGKVENTMSEFCVGHPAAVLQATMISLSVLVGMVFEYWLMTSFLGLKLSLVQVISAMTAARLAFLTPLPGGLGALEASQIMALQAMGMDPAYGVSISLLIRLRDISFGLLGLLVVASLLGWRRPRKAKSQ
jgi:uncharacterized protein (TIRG00374 family)